jgi:3-oxoacyl-[acyl-carrier protein] reductase
MAAHAPVDDSAALARLVASVAEHYGTLDVLVNNAGVTRQIPHADLDALADELIDWIFRVNWRGAFASVRAFRALLAGGDGGLVVNISSIAGTSGFGSNVAYCASKAAWTRSPARWLARIAEDVAETVLAAATLLRFTTGAILPVDSGRPLG